MSAALDWTGHTASHEQLSIYESLEDKDTSSLILQHDLTFDWSKPSITWERDSRLPPGNYLWRVAVHDSVGKVIASAQETIEIGLHVNLAFTASSLITGKSCRTSEDAPDDGLHRRASSDSPPHPQVTLLADPMTAAACRLRPEPSDRFTTSDTLHAFVRIYPADKLKKKNRAEAWSANFVLLSASGAWEATREQKFTLDANPGLSLQHYPSAQHCRHQSRQAYPRRPDKRPRPQEAARLTSSRPHLSFSISPLI